MNNASAMFDKMFIFLRAQENEPKEGARLPWSRWDFPARRRFGRRPRKLAALEQICGPFPSASSMLGTGKWEHLSQRVSMMASGRRWTAFKAFYRCSNCAERVMQ